MGLSDDEIAKRPTPAMVRSVLKLNLPSKRRMEHYFFIYYRVQMRSQLKTRASIEDLRKIDTSVAHLKIAFDWF